MPEPILMKQDKVLVTEVVERNRLRPVSEAGVLSLIASIEELGVMKDAIHVRKLKNGSLVLIAGSHRLEAARRMGWDEIPAKVWTDVTDDWAQLMEIDDNLAGSDMNALDTAVFLATRKEVYERVHPETKRGMAGASARWDASELSSFASVTADKFGMTMRQVQKIVAAGGKLDSSEVARLRAAPKPVTLADLQAIAKVQQPGERYHIVDALAKGEAKNAAAARAAYGAAQRGEQPVVKDPVEEAFNALLKMWDRAPKRAKDRFVDSRREDLIAALSEGVTKVAAE